MPETSRGALLTIEYLGDIHLEQGQAADALEHYDEVFPKALALVPKGDIVAELRRRRAECYQLLDRHRDAFEEAKIGLEHCRELGDRYEEAATYRVLAMSSAALGNAEEAKRWFDQGFAYYEDIETPYEWGKLWMAYGDWLRGPYAGGFLDPKAALDAYHAARDHFEHMGAQAKLAEARARIAEMEQAAAGEERAPTVRERTRPIRRRRMRASAELERRSRWAFENFRIVTEHQGLLHILDDVAKLARSNSPVLILGESGTGKELVAQGIHRLSGRAGNFMPINCGALPKDVIESELFGYVPGAFTGATREKPGLFEVCDGGTAFLDEIGEMPMELQSRLLRYLETGESRRLGSTKNLAVDARIIAATNRDPATLGRGEGFRHDLYYRLAHAVVVLPPLRRRGDDLDLLTAQFLEESCTEHGKSVTISEVAMARLRAHSWPGNVRELKATVNRLVILAPDHHEVEAREVNLEEGGIATTLIEELGEAERMRIAEALRQSRGSRTEAAKALGIPRTTLLNKMRRYGLV